MALSNQKIFDKVARHLLNQGRRSVNSGGSCMYRGVDNTMCAVGCLIPDRLYSKELENRPARNHSVIAVLEKARVLTPKQAADTINSSERTPSKAYLLDRLQEVHDLSTGDTDQAWREYMQKRLAALADAYGLSPTVLEEA